MIAEQGYWAYGRYRRGGSLPTNHKFTGQKLDSSGLIYFNPCPGVEVYQADSQSWLKPNCSARTRPAVVDLICQTGNSLLGSKHQREGSVRGTDPDRLPIPIDHWSVPCTLSAAKYYRFNGQTVAMRKNGVLSYPPFAAQDRHHACQRLYTVVSYAHTLGSAKQGGDKMDQQTLEQSVTEIWKLFKETDAKFKETDAKFKETDAKFKETDARLDQRFRETDRQFKETDAKLRRLEGLFGNQWGRLMEALVQPNVLQLFQSRGHDVRRLHQRSKAQRNGKQMEIDLILENSVEVMAVEVKTVLTVEAISDFLEDLQQFLAFFPLYQGYRLYGVVAGLEVSADVARYAYRRGLFVLRITGEGMVQIDNDVHFQPHDYGASS